jgi:hypothetical protein
MPFDIDSARKAGFTDDQIADEMGAKMGFNVAGARKAGFTSQQILARLQQPSPKDAAQAQVAKDTGTGEAILVGAGHTFDRIGKGMKQGWYAVTGNDKASADLKQQADEEEHAYQALQKEHPVATGVGETLPALAVPVGGGAVSAGSAALRMGAAAAATKGAEYGTPGERLENAAISGVTTTVGGVVIPKAAQALGSVAKTGLKSLAGKITPEALALYDKAKALGVPVNVAQLGDSKFVKTLASTLEHIPFTGAAQWAEKQRTAFTNAVGKTFGEDVPKITPEVYASAKKRIGDTFNDLTKRNDLNVDPALAKHLDGISKDAANTASDDTRAAIENILGRIDEQGSTTGGNVPAQTSNILGTNGQPIVTAPATSAPAVTKVAGSTYQSIDTELGNMIKAGGEKGQYAKRLQSALRDGMDRSVSGADKDAWMQARGQYRNLKAVRDIVAKDMGNGDVPPTALSNALNSTEAGKEAMAMGGRGTLGDLGQVGRQFVRDQVPNSGTVPRYMALSILGGGAATGGAHGVAGLATLMASGATTGRILQKVLTNPKTVDALRRQGISMSDLMKMPPSKIAQLVGGSLGGAAGDNMEN